MKPRPILPATNLMTAEELTANPVLRHKGRNFYFTGKRGTDNATGQDSAEFQAEGQARVWLRADNTITED